MFSSKTSELYRMWISCRPSLFPQKYGRTCLNCIFANRKEMMKKDEIVLDSIESAISDIKAGRVVIVVDDEDRENEGDFVAAARSATPEMINFMATHGRGLICAPLIESRCEELELGLMVQSNSATHETPFTVSVDLLGHGCTTGIS